MHIHMGRYFTESQYEELEAEARRRGINVRKLIKEEIPMPVPDGPLFPKAGVLVGKMLKIYRAVLDEHVDTLKRLREMIENKDAGSALELIERKLLEYELVVAD